MDTAARASQIRQPASPSGTLLRLRSPPAAAVGASMFRLQSKTSDARRTLQPFAPAFTRDVTGILQASTGTSSLPGTSRGESGQEQSMSPRRKRIRFASPVAWEIGEASPHTPVATPSDLNDGSHSGGNSHQQPVNDQQPRNNFSLDRVKHILDHMRYLTPAPWNVPPRRPNSQSQDLPTSAQGRSLGNSIGHGDQHRAGRHTETGAGRRDGVPRTGGASHDRQALSHTEGTLFSGNRPIQDSCQCTIFVRPPCNVRANATESPWSNTTSSSTTSAAPGGPRLATNGVCLPNRQVRGPSLQRSQRSTTAAATSLFPRQTATRRGMPSPHSEVSSAGEQLPEMRRNGGLFRDLPRVSSQRAALSPHLSSTSSSDSRFPPLGHPTREVHEQRHFGTRQLDNSTPTSSFTQLQPPYIGLLPRGPFNPWRQGTVVLRPSPPNPWPISRQERERLLWARSLLLPEPPEMPIFEIQEDEDIIIFDGMNEESGIGTEGLPEAEIDSLQAYVFDPDAHEPGQVSCAVCVSHMESQQLVRVLPCKHEFHASCVDTWLHNHRTCPLCRRDASVTGHTAPDFT